MLMRDGMNQVTKLGWMCALLSTFSFAACGGEQEELESLIVEEDPGCEINQSRACDASGSAGTAWCVEEEENGGARGWTECEVNTAPDPSSSSTPLLISFDGAAVAYTTLPGEFDLTRGGLCAATDWPSARTPWLALDRDGDGAITSGAELFGSATSLASGAHADNGFQALAELDSDGDGRITATDGAFASLRLWADADADRHSSTAELRTLTQAGVAAIELGYRVDRRCTARGNCEVERAAVVLDAGAAHHHAEIVDVHLKHQ